MRKKQAIRLAFIILSVILLAVAGWFFIYRGKTTASRLFPATTQKIQNLVHQINLLASQSQYQFQLIEEKQKASEFKEALDLVIEEKERNREINETALRLTEELKRLTKLLVNFSDRGERQKIETAIQYQLEAISHLLNYGSNLDIVLQELAQKYEAILENRPFEIKRDLNKIIQQIKLEIQAADTSSQKFIQILSEIQ